MKRQQEILDYINEKKIVYFANLCEHFNVSNATMRRDLVSLENLGLIKRFHGGAKSLSYAQNPFANPQDRISDREDKYLKEKESIANSVLPFLKSGDSLMFDASSTCLVLCKEIAKTDLKLTIITNYFSIASCFENKKNISIIYLGGAYHHESFSTSGPIAEQTLGTLGATYAFFGIDGIDPERGLSNNRIDAINIKKIMINHCQKSFCLADYSKFSKNAAVQVTSLENIDYIITNKELPDEVIKKYGAYKDKIIRV